MAKEKAKRVEPRILILFTPVEVRSYEREFELDEKEAKKLYYSLDKLFGGTR